MQEGDYRHGQQSSSHGGSGSARQLEGHRAVAGTVLVLGLGADGQSVCLMGVHCGTCFMQLLEVVLFYNKRFFKL